MTLLALGDADDARGFRLAGVDALVCRTPGDVDRALHDLATEDEKRPYVLLVSEHVYRLAPAAIDLARNRPGWPILIVLPESSESDDS